MIYIFLWFFCCSQPLFLRRVRCRQPRPVSLLLDALYMSYYHHGTDLTSELGMIYIFLWFFCCVITSFFWLFAKVLHLLYCLVHLVVCTQWPELQLCERREKQHSTISAASRRQHRSWWSWG